MPIDYILLDGKRKIGNVVIVDCLLYNYTHDE